MKSDKEEIADAKQQIVSALNKLDYFNIQPIHDGFDLRYFEFNDDTALESEYDPHSMFNVWSVVDV